MGVVCEYGKTSVGVVVRVYVYKSNADASNGQRHHRVRPEAVKVRIRAKFGPFSATTQRSPPNSNSSSHGAPASRLRACFALLLPHWYLRLHLLLEANSESPTCSAYLALSLDLKHTRRRWRS